MTVRGQGVGRPDHTRVQVARSQGDVQITGHDLIAGGDFIIPDDSEVSDPPFVGGGQRSILAVESTDDNNFRITIEYGTLDSDGNFVVDYTYDYNKDANLQGDNDYFIRIDPVRDRVRITLEDTSGASQNNIQGGLNSS